MGRKQKNAPKRFDGRTNRSGPATRQFNRLLAPLGLRLLPVTGDGNCFFRACAVQFQILGRNHAPRDVCDHTKLRQRVCDFLQENRQLYAPYVEAEALDSESDTAASFDEYIHKMRQDGIWAGHLEVHALSAMLETEIIIYLLQAPSYRIRHTDGPSQRQLQLAYHENQHYDAVLPTEIDPRGGRPKELQSYASNDPDRRFPRQETARRQSTPKHRRGDIHRGSIRTENALRVLEL
ncbi:hypothetical protein F1559_002459 [Cyanidiococcus yangmingshanensis]|uniref:OTU domain-containing protein n=1 Tax=Cyanidiococcus yangmingshanensis TaxID=2690220 RepID=A0A7J7IG57_9RHOD|nr:hypothetical protein F1559_002459 [Cyanidiococcus yangmingshanensis]